MPSLTKLFVRWAILALGVALAAKLVPGIHVEDAWALLKVVVLLTLFNAVLRPFLVLFTLPFILVTMGLGIVVINALLFLFVGRIVDGFHVSGFWSAVGGSLVVSLTNIVVSALTARPPPPPSPPSGSSGGRNDVDVIDI